MKYLGIDYGAAKLGLAIGDDDIKVASPYGIMLNDETVLEKISDVLKKEHIDGVVVGLPRSLKGTDSDQTKIVELFVRNLEQQISLPVYTEDETYSTAYAEQLVQGQKSKKPEDDVAAMLILQSFFERQ